MAREVLRDARAADRLPTPEERFLATRPAYERLIADGFLRACIPTAAGGDNESCIDTAVLVEETLRRERRRRPHAARHGARASAGRGRRHPGSAEAPAGAVPRRLTGRRWLRSAPASPAAARTRPRPRPARACGPGPSAPAHGWVINGHKKWVSSATGWQRDGADLLTVVCRTDADAPPERRDLDHRGGEARVRRRARPGHRDPRTARAPAARDLAAGRQRPGGEPARRRRAPGCG